MKLIKRILICGALLVSMTNVLLTGEVKAVSSSSGVGLSAHCIQAYNENWQYSYGSATPGYVDCSGLIWSYNGVGGNRCDMLGASSEWGYVSNGIPRIHGLGLHQPGHVGVYIGSNQAIDARDYGINCVLHNPYQKSWVEWFKIAGVSYPNTGWVLLDGKAYYYENGQYIVDTQRTFDDVTYTFNSLGISDILPPDNVYTETDYSNVKVNNGVDVQQMEAAEAQQRAEAQQMAEAQQRAEAERRAAELKAQREAEKKAAEEKAKAEAEKKAKVEKAKKDAEKKKRIDKERKAALKRLEERRIKHEITERKKNVNKIKSQDRFKKEITEISNATGLYLDNDNFSNLNVLVAKNSTLNNDIKVNIIENDKNDVKIVFNHLSANSGDEVKTEYMDIMYSDVFDFNNDVMAYSPKTKEE